MLSKSLRIIVAAVSLCLLFAGIAIANPGTCVGSKAVQKKMTVKVVKKAVKAKAKEKVNSKSKACNEKTVKKAIIVKKPKKELLGSVIGKTLLDTLKITTTTAGTTSTVETTTPFGNVHLRLYVTKKTKWGIEQYKTAYAAKSDKNGVYGFNKVAAGSYILKVWSPIALPVSDATISVTVKDSEETNVSDIHFVRLGSVVGKTLLDITKETSTTNGSTTTVTSSEPLANVHLRLYEHKKTKRGYEIFKTTNFTKSDVNGQFVFNNVRPGNYILKVWSPEAIPVADKLIEVTVKVNETVTVSDVHFKPRPIYIEQILRPRGHL
jgi:hypothetical protein